MDIDSIFPNFTLFVVIIGPFILVLSFIFLALTRYFKITPVRSARKVEGHTFSEIIGYIPITYMFFPIYEIGEYLYGIRETILDRLFEYHFAILMWLIVLVGIGQVVYAFLKIERDW